MVEFLSVLIGLYAGSHTVELDVVGEVAAVEVRLDGAALATLTRPPWDLVVDFGATPRPHELVAIARDADGDEVDRATRWINLTDSSAAAALSLETGDDGRPAAVQGSTATNTPPHIPQGGPFQSPPGNSATIQTGSGSVFINGKPAARNGDTALTCNDPADLPAGTVVAVGRNNHGQRNVNSWTHIVQVAAGWAHTVGVKTDGTMVAVAGALPAALAAAEDD